MSFKIFEHTADIGIEITGKDFRELLESAGQGFVYLSFDKNFQGEEVPRTIEVDSSSPEDVLFQFLAELLYLLEVKNFIFTGISHIETLNGVSGIREIREIKEQTGGLVISVKGVMRDSHPHPQNLSIKAVTYHQMKIEEDDHQLKTRVVFDI